MNHAFYDNLSLTDEVVKLPYYKKGSARFKSKNITKKKVIATSFIDIKSSN